jgi:hypothetical protein
MSAELSITTKELQEFRQSILVDIEVLLQTNRDFIKEVIKKSYSAANQPLKEVGFLRVDTLESAKATAELLIQSGLVPSSFTYNKSKEATLASVLVALQAGAELGLSIMNSIQGIAVIGGKPMIWGDTVLALCMNSPNFEYIKEEFDSKNKTAICRVKRKGMPFETIRTFSYDQATTAGLFNKRNHNGTPSTWMLYPERMCQMRPRNFALRDAFADVLKGMRVVEDYIGHEEVEINPFDKTVKEFEETSNGGLSAMDSIKNKISQSRVHAKDIAAPIIEQGSESDTPIIDEVTNVSEKILENEQVSVETFDKLESIIVKLSVPTETIAKWLKKAGVEHLDKLTEEQALKLIKKLELKNQEGTHE